MHRKVSLLQGEKVNSYYTEKYGFVKTHFRAKLDRGFIVELMRRSGIIEVVDSSLQ